MSRTFQRGLAAVQQSVWTRTRQGLPPISGTEWRRSAGWQYRGTLGKRITHISTSGLLSRDSYSRLIMDNVSYEGLTATAPTRVGG